MLLDSPPGAGKTGVVERLAVQSLARLRERVMVVTQTNEQAFDLARRLADGFSRLPFVLFARDGLSLPPDLLPLANLQVVHRPLDLPAGPCVVIANAAKWSWVDEHVRPFDLQIVDEAYQLPDYRFQLIAGLARRIVIVGDPGQIAPVITCEVERWATDPAGPHVACPLAVRARHPDLQRLQLSVSRRLVPDTVDIVQPAFYPELPFTALAASGERRLTVRHAATDALDPAIDLVADGVSIVSVELPALTTGESDPELAATIVALIERLLAREATVVERDRSRPLEPGMIGVVCAHVSQVSAVRERLAPALDGVLVETSDRFQGLERPIMLVQHPLSGRADVSNFHLDAGRLCVMLSRHRVACFIVMRAGARELLAMHVPLGDRVLGLEVDPAFDGWKAHCSILEQLQQQERVLPA